MAGDVKDINVYLGSYDIEATTTQTQIERYTEDIYGKIVKEAKEHYLSVWNPFKISAETNKAKTAHVEFEDWLAIKAFQVPGKTFKNKHDIKKFFIETIANEVLKKREEEAKAFEETRKAREADAKAYLIQQQKKTEEKQARDALEEQREKERKKRQEEEKIKYEEQKKKEEEENQQKQDELRNQFLDIAGHYAATEVKIKSLEEIAKNKPLTADEARALNNCKEEKNIDLKKIEELKKEGEKLSKSNNRKTKEEKEREKQEREKAREQKKKNEEEEKERKRQAKEDERKRKDEEAKEKERQREIKRQGLDKLEEYKKYAENHEEKVSKLVVTATLHTYDDLVELRDGLTEALELETQEERREKVIETLNLDDTQVVLFNKEKNKYISIPEFALKRLRKEKNFEVVQVDGINIMAISDATAKKLRRAAERPFETYRIERKLYGRAAENRNIASSDNTSINSGESVNSSTSRLASNDERRGGIVSKIEFEENYQDIPELQDAIADGKEFKYIEEAEAYVRQKKKEAKKKEDDELAKKIRTERDILMKKFLEARAKMIREAQRYNRDRLHPLVFNGDINEGSASKINEIINMAVMSGKQAANNAGAKIASIATDIELFDSERIFAKSFIKVMDEFYKLGSTAADHLYDPTFDMSSLKEEEFVDKGGKYTSGNRWKHRIYSEKIEWNLALDFVPKITTAEHYTMKAILRPAVVKSNKATAKINGIQHEVDFGCLFAATYFYTIVANTPIDENYEKLYKANQWYKPKIAIKLREKHTKLDKNKSWEQIESELYNMGTYINKIRYKKHKHKADHESVRGDWIMTFRGKTFKAFDSVPNRKSRPVAVDYYFDEDDFINPVTQGIGVPLTKEDIYSVDKNGNQHIRNTAFKPFIWELAEQIAEVAGSSDDDFIPVVTNINPRWQILEYGLYTSEPNGPHEGKGAYGLPHGIKASGFTYQAPMGFKRIADAQFNAILARSAEYNKRKGKGDIGNASSYTRGNRSLFWNYDITKMDQPQYEDLLKQLKEQDHTLYDLHSVDATKVWTVKEL